MFYVPQKRNLYLKSFVAGWSDGWLTLICMNRSTQVNQATPDPTPADEARLLTIISQLFSRPTSLLRDNLKRHNTSSLALIISAWMVRTSEGRERRGKSDLQIFKWWSSSNWYSRVRETERLGGMVLFWSTKERISDISYKNFQKTLRWGLDGGDGR